MNDNRLSAGDILEAIQVAFSSEQPPLRQHIPAGPAEQSIEYKYALEFYDSRRWQDISLEELVCYKSGISAAVTFLSDVAFIYYLPLFMRCVVIDYEGSDLLVDSLLSELTLTEEESAGGTGTARFMSLKGVQKTAVAKFLKYLKQSHSESFPPEIGLEVTPDIALKRYWGAFI